jgi:hypothetical protein
MKNRAIRRVAQFVLFVLVACSTRSYAETYFTLGEETQTLAHVPDGVAYRYTTDFQRGGAQTLTIKAIERNPAGIYLFEHPQPLPSPSEYRFETWYRLRDGSARIDILSRTDGDSDFSILDSMKLPASDDAQMWTYCASEFQIRCTIGLRYTIRVHVQNGTLELRGTKLSGPPSLLVNGRFDQRDPAAPPSANAPNGVERYTPRGWRRSYSANDLARQANGSFGFDSKSRALVIEKDQGEFVVASSPAVAAKGAQEYTLRLRIPLGNAPPIPIVRQLGAHGQLSESIATLTRSTSDGSAQLFEADPVTAHPYAERIEVLMRFPATPGEYASSSVDLTCKSRKQNRPEILAGQAGYDNKSGVRILVASDTFSQRRSQTFSLYSDRQRYDGELKPLGRAYGEKGEDWGAYYFEARINSVVPGTYRFVAKLNGHKVASKEIVVSPRRRLETTAELAYRFYSIQRCGCDVPGWHGPCHMDDGRLPDGGHADITGGYHNAGDYHKHMDDNTPVSVYAMVAAYDSRKEFFNAIDRDRNGQSDLLDEALWGADWMLKMVDPKTGRSWRNVTNDIDYWGIPERDTDNILGTPDDRVIDTHDPGDFGAWNIASWAVLARHASDARYLAAGERMWAACDKDLMTNRNPRALIAAIELYKTTHKPQYEDAAARLVQSILALQNADGWFAAAPGGDPQFRIVDEGTIPAALCIFARSFSKSDLAAPVRDSIRRYFQWSFEMADNPFGIIRHFTGKRPFYFKAREEWFGGSNSAYCSTAWAASLAAEIFEDDAAFARRLREHSDNQLHWVFGMNPLGLCMFEGVGNSSIIRYHHTYTTIPGHERGGVPGIIPNGITRGPDNSDCPWFDLRKTPGGPAGAESAEPWLPHNAYYMLALSAED